MDGCNKSRTMDCEINKACASFPNRHTNIQNNYFSSVWETTHSCLTNTSFKVTLSHGTRSPFSSSRVLHSNSQLANALSSPAKNACRGSTPITLTAFDRINQDFSDTQTDAAESKRCTAACPREAACDTSLSTPFT